MFLLCVPPARIRRLHTHGDGGVMTSVGERREKVASVRARLLRSEEQTRTQTHAPFTFIQLERHRKRRKYEHESRNDVCSLLPKSFDKLVINDRKNSAVAERAAS
ncbi:uncharacterized, partial [Tachysurus ichikawai]